MSEREQPLEGADPLGDVPARVLGQDVADEGSEAGLGGGAGDPGAGGDLAGDFGGLDEEGDEPTVP